MKKVIIIIIFITSFNVFSQNKADQCFECHEAIGDQPSTLFKNDIHKIIGVACSDCHGGDPTSDDMEKAKSKASGFIGVPKGDNVSKVCTNCHSNAQIMVKRFNSALPSNQEALLAQSVHGRLSITGKERIVKCITCHNAHGIVSVKDPSSPVYPVNTPKTCAKCHSNAKYMRTYNPALPVDQLEKYRTSEHGILNAKGDAKAAECANCHGSHEIRSAKDVKSKVYAINLPKTCSTCHSSSNYMRGYKIPLDQFEKYSNSVHGKLLLEKNNFNAPACNDCHGNHSATPPGVESISKVCGTCHALSAELFAASPHKKAFDQKQLPECETCHGNHEIITATDKLLGVQNSAVCKSCHGDNPESKAFITAKFMKELRDSLVNAEKNALLLINEAEQKGIEISEAKFKLRDAKQALFESRTMVHSFDRSKFQEVIDRGLTAASTVTANVSNAIEDYFFRRWGLGVSTLIITIVAVSLYLYIRRIEKKQKSTL
jgi:predicted CXXCH cytochrome family protein